MKLSAKKYKRVVIKIGSSLFYSGKCKLDCGLVNEFAGQVSRLVEEGAEIVIVSSGAIALGMSLLGLSSRPKDLSYLQAAAAIGQNELMNVYQEFFGQKGLKCGQVLLTWEDLNERSRYLNAKNTLLTLLKLKTVPIINENDTVSTDEIKFGDNDKLSAMVASLIGADLLIILSDVDGLLERDKKTVVRTVEKITPQVRALASPTEKKTCVGGMITKIDAAKIAQDSGISCVIANGRQKNIILDIIKDPSSYGTLFLAGSEYLAAKKRWIAFSAKAKGKIFVDEGARQALLNKKSLLSVGVTSVEGDFKKGDIVSLRSKDGEFAKGRVAISSKELSEVKGKRHEREIIHRDNIVINR